MTTTPPRATTLLPPQDEHVIRAIVADTEDAFNDNDVEKSLRHFAEDAVVVNASGVVLDGRDAIRRATVDALTGYLATATAFYEPFAIAAITPEVALVNKRAWSSRSDFEASKPAEMVALYVFARKDGRWWIVRRENTLTHG